MTEARCLRNSSRPSYRMLCRGFFAPPYTQVRQSRPLSSSPSGTSATVLYPWDGYGWWATGFDRTHGNVCHNRFANVCNAAQWRLRMKIKWMGCGTLCRFPTLDATGDDVFMSSCLSFILVSFIVEPLTYQMILPYHLLQPSKHNELRHRSHLLHNLQHPRSP